MVKIRCLDISKINQSEYEKIYHLCSAERKNKINRYVHNNDKKRSVCAEMLLKYAWIESGRNSEKLIFLYNEYGKPCIQNDENFYFNLSHSSKWVVIAYAKSSVGIDIEQVKENQYSIMENFFCEKEKKYIQNATSKKEFDSRFIRVWTIKESYLKFLGTGLYTELNSFDIDINEEIQLVNEHGEMQKNLYFHSELFDEDYYLSICGIEKEIHLQEIYTENLLENESISLL